MSSVVGPDMVNDGLIFCIDAANQRSYSSNVFPYPTDFYSFAQNGSGRVTVSRDNIESPVGNTPLKLTQTATGGRGYTVSYNNAAYNIAPATAGETWTFSFWAKSSVNNPGTGAMYIFGANSSGTAYVNNAWLNIYSKGIQITTEWQRFEGTFTFTNPDVAYIHVRVDTDNDAAIGDQFWYDGFQVEKTSSATSFNPKVYGDTINDLSNKNNFATKNSSVLYGESQKGEFVFDGSSSIITLPATMNEFNPDNNPVTLEAWFKPTSIPSATGTVFTDNYIEWGILYNTNQTISARCYGTINIAHTANEWCQVVITHITNTTAGTYTFNAYYNGNFINSLSGTTGNGLNDRPYAIGADYQGGTPIRFFDGEISTVRIYQKELSASEIKNNFEALRGRHGI